jgi:sterol 3beta-glucosyltransferase
MKAVLFSIGTRGDIEPFLAIAVLLRAKKWEVLCVFPEQFRELVEQMGFAFKGFSSAFLEMLEGSDTKMLMGGQGSLFKRLKLLISISKTGLKLATEMVAQQHQIQETEKPDLICYHPKCNYALVWGMQNPGRTILISPIPFMAHPINHLTALGNNYGKWINRCSFWLTNTVKAIVLSNQAKKYLDKKPGNIFSVSAIKKAMLEQEKTLYMISPSLFPKPDYWPACAKVVGYYERDKTMDWKPDQTLIDFLNYSEKIIFITFGSMSNSDPEGKTKMILDILQKHNIRAIINTSWGGLKVEENHPDNVYFVQNVPYDWIFPKMYAVIHHGGSGTTHTALKYGCPCLIIPHIIDQFYWNRTIAALKLGPLGVPIRDLSERNFELKLLDLLYNSDYKINAVAISEKMKIESDMDKLYDLLT